MIKEKLKNCLLTVILSILFIASMFAIISLSSCNVKKTILSNDINIENDNLNLKKDYHTDSNGNVVSDNLLNTSNIVNGFYSDTSYGVNSFNVSSGYLYIYNPTVNNTSGVSLNVNVLANTSYTFKSQVSSRTRVVISSFVNGQERVLVDNLNYTGEAITFTTLSDNLWFIFYAFYTNDIYWNQMCLNVGSSAIAYEPYGTFVPSSLISNNLFYNASFDYYFNLNVANFGISHVIGADLLQGDTYLSINQFMNLYVNSNDRQAYNENTNVSYWKLTFNKLFPLEQLILNFDSTQANTFDYYVTYYFNDGSTYIYHNASSSDFYRSFVVDLTQVNGLSGKLVESISFRRQYSYTINTISVGSYLIGFNDGLTQANNNHKEELDSLSNIINEKDSEIQDLEFTIRELNDRLNTNINNLFYTMISAVMSTPFNILHDYLNWNFFGINLFSLFTSLVTLLIILWVVKFLLGRK